MSKPIKRYKKASHYYRTVGIIADYYNIDYSSVEAFYDIYYNFYRCTLIQGHNIISERLDDLMIILRADVLVYRDIVDAVLQNKQLSERQLVHIAIRAVAYLPLDTQYTPIVHADYWHPREMVDMLHSIYKGIMNLAAGNIRVKRCMLDGCSNILIIGGQGKPQRYCSSAHKSKAFRLRKTV